MRTPPGRLTAAPILLALLAASASFSQVSAAPPPAPAVVAGEFYRWYLRSLANDREPLTQDRENLKRYVSRTLIDEIDRRINSPDGLDEDYFIKAQDYLNEWLDDVTATQIEIHGARATAIVTLGGKSGARYRLRVALDKVMDSWKITKVQKLRD